MNFIDNFQLICRSFTFKVLQRSLFYRSPSSSTVSLFEITVNGLRQSTLYTNSISWSKCLRKFWELTWKWGLSRSKVGDLASSLPVGLVFTRTGQPTPILSLVDVARARWPFNGTTGQWMNSSGYCPRWRDVSRRLTGVPRGSTAGRRRVEWRVPEVDYCVEHYI